MKFLLALLLAALLGFVLWDHLISQNMRLSDFIKSLLASLFRPFAWVGAGVIAVGFAIVLLIVVGFDRFRGDPDSLKDR